VRFFTSNNDDVGTTFKYLALILAFNLIMIVILNLLYVIIIPSYDTVVYRDPTFGERIFSTLLVFAVGLIFTLGFSFVAGAIFYIVSRTLGAKGTYADAYRLYIYGSTPVFLFLWMAYLPAISLEMLYLFFVFPALKYYAIFLLAFIWPLVNIILGSKIVFKLSTLRAILASVAGMLISYGIMIYLIGFLVYYIFWFNYFFW